MKGCATAALVACVIFTLTTCARAVERSDETVCGRAGAIAERQSGIPDGLLQAIGTVESGRRDASGSIAPWPWTLDLDGRPTFYPTRDAALAGLSAAVSGGVSSVDVGCFQVNLAQHPDAFRSLDDALDPVLNANYAARFLAALDAGHAEWDDAVARYHSASHGRGIPYRLSVLAAWTDRPADSGPVRTDPHVIPVSFSDGGLNSRGPETASGKGEHRAVLLLPNVIGPQ